QPDEAMRHLELAERHPLAPRLRLSAALSEPDAAALAAAQIKIGFPATKGNAGSPVSSMAAALAIDVAEAWLYRHNRPGSAAKIVDRVLAGALPDAWRAHVVTLAVLAHSAAGNWK